MAVQRSVAVRDAQANAVETTIGTGPLLRIRTGAQPANCAASRTGTLLVSITLPSDWLAASSGGVKVKAGTWTATASGTGTAGHYEIMDSGGTVCHEQGSVTITGGGGDMTVDNTSITAPQTVTISTYQFTVGNA